MRPRIVVVAGLPGSGKSTYLSGLGANALSSDGIRRMLSDDETNQGIHGRVFATLRYLLQQRVALDRPVTYIDATNLTRRERKPYIQMARKLDCEVEAMYFDVPLAVCLERNAARSRVVPANVLEAMAAKMIPPSEPEGFSRVEVIGWKATD